MSKVWFVTGAGRGLGIDIAQNALAAGHSVVATGRKPDAALKAIGARANLLTTSLDITDPQAAITVAKAAPTTAVHRGDWPTSALGQNSKASK
jgi:NAD(P)-dependent dehydrogenase (short-subunit alcohol dehydrogenase family)